MKIDFSDIEPVDEGEVSMMVIGTDGRLYRITNDPTFSFKAFAISDVTCLILMSKNGGPYDKCYRVCNLINDQDLEPVIREQFELRNFNVGSAFALLKSCLTDEYLEESEILAEFWVSIGLDTGEISDTTKLSTAFH